MASVPRRFFGPASRSSHGGNKHGIWGNPAPALRRDRCRRGRLQYALSCRQATIRCLVGVCDIREEPGRERAAMLDVPFYTDYRQMIDELKPDVAVVITPHYNHAEIAIYCLRGWLQRAGREADGARSVRGRRDDRGRASSPASCWRSTSNTASGPKCAPRANSSRKADWASSNGLNMVTPWPRSAAYYGQASWRATWPGEGGGVLMNQAPHDLDLVCHLMGRPDGVVAWTRTTLHKIEVEDTATALLSWDGGATGYLHVSTAEAGPRGNRDRRHRRHPENRHGHAGVQRVRCRRRRVSGNHTAGLGKTQRPSGRDRAGRRRGG